jgi:hypothetical protein
MEKRQGMRVEYSNTTVPSLDEVNDRLLSAEGVVAKMLNTQWREDRDTYENIWVRYSGNPSSSPMIKNIYNTEPTPNSITLLYHPIISIEKLEIIINGVFVDLITEYEEGWDKDYYIDYRNGAVTFRTIVPEFMTPIRIQYTHGRLESNDGYVMVQGVVLDDVGPPDFTLTETAFYATIPSVNGQYNGKLIKITSGDAVDNLYRVITSTYESGATKFTFTSDTALITDGLEEDATFNIYCVPKDIQELIKIYAYLGILINDPTYQHNLENPFDEPHPLYEQFAWLKGRFNEIIVQRTTTIQLIN